MPQVKSLNHLYSHERHQLGNELGSLRSYFSSIGEGLGEILDVLRRRGFFFGLVTIPTPQLGSLGDRHTIILNRAVPDLEDGVEIENSVLVLTTYQMPSGNIEMESYVS